MIVDLSKKEQLERYKLMSQTIIPRPIAWVVSENEKGVVNVAPFSYFTALSSNPPTILISVGHKSDKTPKDTLRNIQESKKCVVCIASPKQLDKMHLSSKELGENESEAEVFNIPLKNVVDGFPPMVEGSPVAFFCEFYSEIELEGSKTIPLILEIKYQYLNDEIIKDKERMYIDFEPIARVGKKYFKLGEELEAPLIK